MKTLSGKKLLQDLGLKAGELVRVGDTVYRVYRYDPEVFSLRDARNFVFVDFHAFLVRHGSRRAERSSDD